MQMCVISACTKLVSIIRQKILLIIRTTAINIIYYKLSNLSILVIFYKCNQLFFNICYINTKPPYVTVHEAEIHFFKPEFN